MYLSQLVKKIRWPRNEAASRIQGAYRNYQNRYFVNYRLGQLRRLNAARKISRFWSRRRDPYFEKQMVRKTRLAENLHRRKLVNERRFDQAMIAKAEEAERAFLKRQRDEEDRRISEWHNKKARVFYSKQLGSGPSVSNKVVLSAAEKKAKYDSMRGEIRRRKLLATRKLYSKYVVPKLKPVVQWKPAPVVVNSDVTYSSK